eukprot:scaffold42462_cov58-Phaeocystis_antarctica.AAC.4
MGFWGGGGRQRPSSRKVGVARAGRLHGTWENALSRGVASDAHESTGKPEQAFQSAESALLGQDRPISGACAANSGRLHTANYPVVYRPGILGRTVLAPPGWPRALERERCSGRIGASLSRRGPRRTRCPVVLSQSYRGHPAAATVRG